MPVVTTSKRWNLKLPDIWRGLIVAALTPVVTIIGTSIDQGQLTFNWKLILWAAAAAAFSYWLKNFATPSRIVVKDPSEEMVDAVDKGVGMVTVEDTRTGKSMSAV